MVTEVKNTVLWTYVIDDFKEEEINCDFLRKIIAKTESKKN